MTSSFELIDSIEAGSTLKLNVVKKGLINIPIPCMDVSFLIDFRDKIHFFVYKVCGFCGVPKWDSRTDV